MSNIAVVYHSKHGSTEKYAKWIAEETGAVLFKEQECKAKQLVDFDVVVYGGAVHAGGILGIKFLQKGIKELAGKKVMAFAVGLMVDTEETQEQCREINFIKGISEVPCYFLPGAYNPEEIKGMDKAIIGIVKKMVESKKSLEITDKDRELMKTLESGGDFMDKKYLQPLLEALESYN